MLLTWLAVCLVLGSIGWLEYLRDTHQIEQGIRVREAARVELFAQLYGQHFRNIAADLRVLTQNLSLQDFLASGRPDALSRLTREMALLSRQNENYDQVRFIDTSGQERVRINRNGEVVPPPRLQLKADRPYFRDTLPLAAGQIYLSAFDLNIENGVVERPFKPTLRFASPVFDGNGRRRGVVVINYLGTRLLDSFLRLQPLYQDRMRVLNEKGYWLRGPRSEDEQGYMMPERDSRTLAAQAPVLWAEVLGSNLGQSRALGGLFTWRRITPANVVGLAGSPVRDAGSYLVVASDLDAAAWQQSFVALRLQFAVAALALFGFTTALTFSFCSRRQFNERIGAMHRHNTALLRAANIAVTATNLDGILTDFNPAAERLLGWSASEVIGKQTPAIFFDAAEVEQGAKQLSIEFGRAVSPGFDVFVLRALRDGIDERELTAVRKDGRRVSIWLSTSLLQDAHGRVTGYLGVVSDLTLQKQAEQSLRDARTAAEESAKLKSRFLANMSHEIRTPMNGVLGMTELLLDTSLTEDQRMLATTVRTSADSLLTVINDILDFSKIEAGQLTFDPQPFHLVEPIESCLAIMAERASAKGLEIAYLVEDTVPERLVGDSGRIHQILLNLVGNAIKFSTKGEVILTVAKLSELNQSARLRFAVRDTGLGISARQQARLFQPFVQVDGSSCRKFGGTGLGLAISKQLVSLMGGEMGVESEPGKGATFWFTIDLLIAASQPKDALCLAGLSGRRALIVDDNNTNLEILGCHLAAWGVRSTAVSGGDPALAALRSAAAEGSAYDLAVLDMYMPGMTGLEIARLVRADRSLAAPKMIILTSMSHSIPRQELDDAGVGICLVKPVRRAQFHEALVSLLGASPAGRHAQAGPQPDETVNFPGNLRILVAEDNPVNQLVVRRQLERAGHHPDVVENGAQAVHAARSGRYDLVLMDCQMPEMNGFEATRQIRKWEAERQARGESPVPLHIIAMTANAMAGDREACLDAGMNDYVSKPLHLSELAAALARSPAAQAQAEAAEPVNV
jgi:PAS domain S-box-containing protein